MFRQFLAILGRLKEDDLTRHSVMMTSAGLMAGLFNYLYQLQMGRMLPRADYGVLFSLLSLSAMLGTVSQTFQNATSRFTSTFRVQGSLGKIRSIWMFFLIRTLLLGVVLFSILALLTPVMSRFLDLEDWRYFLVLCASLVLGFALPVNMGLLQGLQRFLPLAICQVLVPLIKVMFGALFVYLGLGVNGGLMPLLVGSVAVFAVSAFYVRDVATVSDEKCEIGGMWSYTGLTLLAILSFGIMMNVDVVMARHYLGAEGAGDYSAMAVLGRMALYAPMGIGTAMFPKTSELFETGADPRRAMRKALFYTVLAGGAVLLVYCFLHGFVIDSVFKGEYEFRLSDLLKYGSSMLLFSVSFLLMNYLLSVKQTSIAYASFAASALLIALLAIFHSGAGQFVDVLLACGAVSVVLTLPFYMRDRRRYQS